MKVEADVLEGASSAAPSPAGQRRSLRVLLHNAVAALAVLAAWQAATFVVYSVFFPSPWQVARAFVDLGLNGDVAGHTLLTHMTWSMARLAAGFIMGVVLGVPLGLLMGLYKPLYAGTRAALEPFRFIPPIAWIPLP